MYYIRNMGIEIFRKTYVSIFTVYVRSTAYSSPNVHMKEVQAHEHKSSSKR
jgi:hypothetical protein